jgi:3-dehydroquinate synthase
MSAMQELDVALGTRSYPIRIGAKLLGAAERWHDTIRGRHVLVVSNTTVAPLYLERVQAGLSGFEAAHITLADGEQHKTLRSVEQVFDALSALGATRDACILALGGGVVGDIAGFAAASWMRGIDFVQMPTTLLAMVDSSVGGKTGVNLPAGKNLIGAFHQPRAVIADTGTLATLPEREYRAGLAEAIKHSALGDAVFFERLEPMRAALLARDDDALATLIAHSCRFKAAVVARDETEHGERALLNFGHTFGHALEAEAGYGTLLHGEAVAIGMVLAARLSARLGMPGADDGERLRGLLRDFGLPVTLPSDIDPEALIRHMRLDKKNRAGELRLILWRGIGRAEIVSGVDEAAVRDLLDTAIKTPG